MARRKSAPRRLLADRGVVVNKSIRVGGFDTPYPASRIEEDFLPDLDRVLDAVDRSLGW